MAALAIGLMAAAGLGLVAGRKAETPAAVDAPAANRPQLMLLTTLPLMFGDKFGLDQQGSPALRALEARFTVVPVAVADRPTLARSRLLLMAHPLAQPAEALVELDQWVRRGGRLLLLADPLLEWPSERPLGDPLRPPPAFADTGLLAHWGLRLDAPDERGPRQQELAGQAILTASPGALIGLSCAISRDRLVAHCSVGQGKATIVADADFLDVDQLDGPVSNNLNAMVRELEALDR
ncbi:MAG: hypothetical protein ABIO69_07495 [Sphingomicrobium sp.]